MDQCGSIPVLWKGKASKVYIMIYTGYIMIYGWRARTSWNKPRKMFWNLLWVLIGFDLEGILQRPRTLCLSDELTHLAQDSGEGEEVAGPAIVHNHRRVSRKWQYVWNTKWLLFPCGPSHILQESPQWPTLSRNMHEMEFSLAKLKHYKSSTAYNTHSECMLPLHMSLTERDTWHIAGPSFLRKTPSFQDVNFAFFPILRGHFSDAL